MFSIETFSEHRFYQMSKRSSRSRHKHQMFQHLHSCSVQHLIHCLSASEDNFRNLSEYNRVRVDVETLDRAPHKCNVCSSIMNVTEHRKLYIGLNLMLVPRLSH